MLEGEAPDRRKLGVLGLACVAFVAALAVLSAIRPDRTFLVAADMPAEVDRLGAVELATAANSALALQMVETVKMQQSAITAAAQAYTALQAQINAQRDEIAALKDVAKAAPRSRRSRNVVPDPPAASYFKMQ